MERAEACCTVSLTILCKSWICIEEVSTGLLMLVVTDKFIEREKSLGSIVPDVLGKKSSRPRFAYDVSAATGNGTPVLSEPAEQSA